MTGRLGAIAAFLALSLLAAPSATASSLTMSTADYEAAHSFIGETKEVMREAETALTRTDVTAEEAATRKADLATRLDQLRRLMTHAVQRDRIGARGKVTPERERARKIISEAGKIEDPLQDLWVAWSQQAKKYGYEPTTWRLDKSRLFPDISPGLLTKLKAASSGPSEQR